MSEQSSYTCKTKCVFPIEINQYGETADFLFIPKAEGIDERYFTLNAKAGTLVPHHFAPANDQAEEDRDDQITNPENYIETDMDLGMIAELMVDAGIYEDDGRIDRKSGKWVVIRPAKSVAFHAIRETIGEAAYKALVLGKETASQAKSKDAAIQELLSVSKDVKEQRKSILKVIADAKITKGFFRGAPPEKLAEFAYDKGLCEA